MMIISVFIWTLILSVQVSFTLLITQKVIYMHVFDGKTDFVQDTLSVAIIIL